jgi:hypothetical protein
MSIIFLKIVLKKLQDYTSIGNFIWKDYLEKMNVTIKTGVTIQVRLLVEVIWNKWGWI